MHTATQRQRPRRRVGPSGPSASGDPSRPPRPSRQAVPAGRPGPAPERQPPAPQREPVRVGEWLWTTREGAEQDLIEELALLGVQARLLGPALVASAPAGRGKQQEIEPAFARQGLRVLFRGPALVEPICGALRPHLRAPLALHVWVPDTDAGNARSAQAAALRKGLEAALTQASGADLLKDGPAAREAGGLLAQVALLSDTEAVVGIGPAMQAQSLAPGGRLRSGAARRAPSRSAAKLDEALSWLGRGPEPGDVCVDLGAAPGGWTQVLLSRRAKVVAVDPGLLRPELRRSPDVDHLKMSAFQFEPEIPADWLLCDMAWRPLEVAALLAKWGRRHWARFLLCNIKLPMRRRAEMLRRVREILATGGWTGIRARQLYHDRDEVTLTAWRGFGGDARPPRKARTS